MTVALQMPGLLDEKQDWTVEDLASLPKDLRYELIDGRLILPSPTVLHQDLCVELVSMLKPGCPAGYRPVVDLSFEVDRLNEPRPDVAVVAMRYGRRTPVPIDGAMLVAEIVSPTSHFRDMHAKTKVYASAGVQHYWVLDPWFKGGAVLTVFQPGPTGSYEIVTSTNKTFNTDVPFPVTIDLPELTELIDEYKRAEEAV